MTMTQLTNEQIIDFLDGTLSPEDAVKVDNHLKTHPEEAALVDELRFAQSFTSELREEPMRVSDNFWPQLRDQLGPAPKRSVWSNARMMFSGATGVKSSSRTTKMSLGAAFAVIAIAASALLFSPKDSTPVAVATPISEADKTFIQQSMEKHEAYVASEPIVGDVTSLETGSEAEEDDEINP